MSGRSLCHSAADTPPFWMGISMLSPVRLSVTVTLSAIPPLARDPAPATTGPGPSYGRSGRPGTRRAASVDGDGVPHAEPAPDLHPGVGAHAGPGALAGDLHPVVPGRRLQDPPVGLQPGLGQGGHHAAHGRHAHRRLDLAQAQAPPGPAILGETGPGPVDEDVGPVAPGVEVGARLRVSPDSSVPGLTVARNSSWSRPSMSGHSAS